MNFGSIGKGIGNYFKTLGLTLLGQMKVSIATFLSNFVQQDLGHLAVDAVNYSATLLNATPDEKRQAAKDKLVEDLKAAGHADVTQFGQSTLNFLIESAYQAVLASQTEGILHINM
jgi:heme oxygenase